MIPSLIQAFAALLALRRFPVFGLSLLVWLPVLLWWRPGDPESTWHVWLPCAVIFAHFQTAAALEAVYRFGERYLLAVRLTVTFGFFAVAAALYCWLRMPITGGVQRQVTVLVTYQRVGVAVFLVLAIALYATFVKLAEFRYRVEGRHLLVMAAIALSWAVPALWPRGGWFWWHAFNERVVWLRTGWLVVWMVGVGRYRR